MWELKTAGSTIIGCVSLNPQLVSKVVIGWGGGGGVSIILKNSKIYFEGETVTCM